MSPNREKLQKKNYIEKIYPTRITVKYLAINVEGFFFFFNFLLHFSLDLEDGVVRNWIVCK